MEPITQAQSNQIKAWAEERDSILKEISAKREELNALTLHNAALAASSSEISTRIVKSEGRLIEVEKKETEMSSKISSEIAELTAQKTALQSEVSGLVTSIPLLIAQKDLLVETIENYKDVSVKIFKKTTSLDKVVDHVTSVNKENIHQVDELVKSLEKSVKKVIETNEANVKKANQYIDELPKIFFAIQKAAPIKKTM
jgi:uncharacterized coiled-coil DUF342 family protein